jgi:tRNA threonylcarbamoyladenosine biosynthesis protein TsaE
MNSFTTLSLFETEKVAAELASFLSEKYAKTRGLNLTIALDGDLGAGKTAFTSAFARALGFPGRVHSPTFTIVNEYSPAFVNETKTAIYHFDVYRITSDADLESTGFFDYDDGIKVIEWFSNIKDFVDPPDIMINITVTGENTRKILTKIT